MQHGADGHEMYVAVRISQPDPRGQANVSSWWRWLFPMALTGTLVTLLLLSGRSPR